MMKKIKKFTIICLVTGLFGMFTGCDNWLDVQPYDSMTENQLYSTELGIQKALNGLYLKLTSNDLYAKELTCGTLDVLAQRYYLKTAEHVYYDMGNYRYTNDAPKAKFETIWKSAYKLIADCNEFLQETPRHQSVLVKQDFSVMMGEALAVRTLMHFDMFRLFGPVYTEANKEREAIPYYDKVTDVPQPILTAYGVMEELLADIDTALVWMANDPIRTQGLGDKDGEGYWDYRNYRLNYYAAWTLKARMLWYMGKGYEAEAHQIAVALLAGKDPGSNGGNNFNEIFKAVSNRNASSDRVFSSEILFGLHNMKRDDVYKSVFSTELEDKNVLWVTSDYYKRIYTETNDYRNYSFEAASADRGEVQAFVKFKPGSTNVESPYGYQTQALIRMSELYLIAASTTENEMEKKEYLEALRLNRGYQTGNSVGIDLEVLLDEEYQREFYGEGQYFFFLKRNQVSNVKNQEGNTVSMSNSYIIPLPESETNNRYN